MDTAVQVTGNCGPEYNHKRQLFGFHLWTYDLALVKVIEPARAAPFSLGWNRSIVCCSFTLAIMPVIWREYRER